MGIPLNKKNKITDSNQEYTKKLAFKTTMQFIAAALIYETVLLVLLVLIVTLIEWIRLHYTDALNWVKPMLIPIGVVLSLAGVGVIAYRFFKRPLEYLDQVAGAARQLAHPTEAPIFLPENLRNIEADLNEVRIQTLESRKNASKTEQRKDDLLVYLAHDLKTPLTSVLGYLKLMEDEPDISPELIAKYSGIARSKAERLEELINEFFEITRFSTSKLSLELAPTNLSRMLMQITYEFQPVLAQKELKWDLNIPDNVLIQCDPDKLERAVDNLIRNAVHYSFENSAIDFSLEPAADKVIIRIQNKGNTIPPEKLERIFEQFYRLDDARSADTGGAGLGLAIAREIIELHHGTITAASADETITFEISLPLNCKKNV